jgi:hypothetical protein
MKIKLLGTGTPTPSLTRMSSGYTVSVGKNVLLFDHGPGAHQRMLECGTRAVDVTHLFFFSFALRPKGPTDDEDCGSLPAVHCRTRSDPAVIAGRLVQRRSEHQEDCSVVTPLSSSHLDDFRSFD